jgi:hypothetical protein
MFYALYNELRYFNYNIGSIHKSVYNDPYLVLNSGFVNVAVILHEII